MNVLFLTRDAYDESPVLAEVSAALRAAGHATSLLVERLEGAPWAAARALGPGLAVVQASVLAERWAALAAARAKAALGVPVAMAGSLPTFAPERALESDADLAIIGDAEDTLVDLAGRVERGEPYEEVAGLAYRRGGRVTSSARRSPRADLDTLPLPDRELYWSRYPALRDFPWKRFLASRGCVYACTYCYQPLLRRAQGEPRDWLRVKSVGRVVAEVRDAAERAPLTHVHFGDDLFGARVAWLEDLAERFPREIGLGFSCQLAPELATERTVALLARAGCRALGIGVESGDEERRRTVLNRSASDAVTLAAARRVRAAGIALVTFNLVGAPGEGADEVWRTIRFNHALRTDFARVTLAFGLPGGELFGAGPPPPPPSREVRNLFHLFGWATALPWAAPALRVLARWPLGPLAASGLLVRLWKEFRTFRVPLVAGARFFLRVGAPSGRTQAFAALP
ncbi:MAG: radical SAM protein [Deltaproteobacteria bacterium]|nr:radical SAM protein [Deltaproteobacteria bacterium]